jgi:hypothetical protein
MSQEGTKVIAIATILVIAVSSTAFLYITSVPNDDNTSNTLDIASITVCGNSTDILYPELMDASLFFQDGNWTVSASFVDDSEGWENPELYDREFTIASEEVMSISLSFLDGLNDTYPSEMSVSELLEPSPHIGFEIEIIYSDGSWVYVTTFQIGEGYIISNSGTGTPDRNLLSGSVLEPVSALDGLVEAIYTVFSNHLIGT